MRSFGVANVGHLDGGIDRSKSRKGEGWFESGKAPSLLISAR